MVDYELFEHKADIGIRGFGKTLEQAFVNAAKAMFSVMINLKKVELKHEIEIECSADNEEELLVEWLNALLAEMSIKNMAFADFEVKIEDNKLSGKAMGEELDQQKHEAKTEVKAATYSELKIKKVDGKYMVQCVVDV